MFPLSALLAHAELKTRAKRPSAEPPSAEEARRAVRITRYGNLTLYPRVERAETVDMGDPFAPGESMSSEVIDAVWEEPRVIATLSNVSTSGVGLILSEELPAGLEFDVNWEEGERPGPVRFEVVHTQPLSAGMYRTGARLVAGELPAEPVPTPFVRRFEMASDAEPAPVPMDSTALVPAASSAAESPAAEPMGPRMSLVRDGVMALSRVPTEPSASDARPAPAGTFKASLAGGFEKTERLDGVTVCGWERSIEIRRDGERMWIYVHSPGKKNGWGIFVDADQFEGAVNRVQAAAGSPFVATTLAA
jgi:hypothetical protein